MSCTKPNISSEFSVAYDENGFVVNQKCFLITGKGLKYLMALLNSKLNFFYFKLIGASLGNAGYEMSKIFVNKLPIKKIFPEAQKPFIDLVDQILAITSTPNYDSKKPPIRQKELEAKIDELIYKLYNLTYEEVKIVDPDFGMSGKEWNVILNS